MASGVTYLGTVQTIDHGAPVLARANDLSAQDEAMKETSGGVIFTETQDMPSLEELLEAHGVLYAVLQTPAPSVNDRVMTPLEEREWQEEARERLSFNLGIADEDGVMDEDFVFLAALGDDAIEEFLDRAYRILDDAEAGEEGWHLLLDAVARDADVSIGHEPLPMTDAVADETPDEPPLLLSLSDLDVAFSAGAMGGPPPLSDRGLVGS
jgi:hypothetical protein